MWSFRELGDRVALVGERGETLSYLRLAEEGGKLASAVGGRCLVFIRCRNTFGALIGVTACLDHGIVPLLLDDRMDEGLFAALAETYGPAWIWRPGSGGAYDAWGYTLVGTGYGHAWPLHDDLALLLTTSGSTGSPKLVRHSYGNLRSNIDAIVAYLGIDGRERPITSLPMHYTYGLSVLTTHLMAGASMVLTERTVMQREYWRLMRDLSVTSMAGVPYTYEMLARLRFFGMDLPSLTSMNQAGGKLSPELQGRFVDWAAETGRKFWVMYGQTEASPRMGYLPWDRAKEKYGCMGIPIPGGSIALVDEDGVEGDEGELVYSGPNVTLGYAERGEDLARGDDRHGVLRTGDLARRDADGFYTIVGRKARFVKLFGNRVSLDETERLVKRAFPDLDCACCGGDDAMAVFVAGSCDEEAVGRLLSERTGLNRIAFVVRRIGAIPKNAAGKTVYKELGNV